MKYREKTDQFQEWPDMPMGEEEEELNDFSYTSQHDFASKHKTGRALGILGVVFWRNGNCFVGWHGDDTYRTP